jgi:putative ABC transport system permease protein
MLKNYFLTSLRTLLRNKVHSLITVFGLSLGIAACFLIALYVKDELTFDRFHSRADRIYRVFVKEDWGENQQFFNTVTPYPMGPTLKENFAEVEHQVRILRTGTQVRSGEGLFNESLVVAGKDFFDTFDFTFSDGDPRVALADAHNVVLSRRMAAKYFGDIPAVGKTLTLQLAGNFEDFNVAAVTEDVPSNSSIRYDILVPDANMSKLVPEDVLNSGWFNVNPETYVLLREGTDPEALTAKFPALFKSLLGEEEFVRSKYAPGLQPLLSIHLDNSYPQGDAPVSDMKYSYILSAIALLILFVACINFVTLSVGRALRRSKEVAIRKTSGAARAQLIRQFIGEAALVVFFALVVGVAVAFALLDSFNEVAGKDLEFPSFLTQLSLGVSFLVIIGLLAGSYPAFVLSSFQPMEVLKGKLNVGSNKGTVRRILVGVQLVLSIFLVSSTLIMGDQLQLLQSKNLGFNKEQLVVIPLRPKGQGGLVERVKEGFGSADIFKTELDKSPEVTAVCAASHDFGKGNWTQIGYTDDEGTYRNFNMNVIDDDYLPLMEIKLAAGRNFSHANPSDSRRSILVNQAFVREYGWTDALGKRIPGKKFPDHEIIGVVEDFNFMSLHSRVMPLVIVQDLAIALGGSENISINSSPLPKLFIRLAAGRVKEGVAAVEKVWAGLTEGEEFSFSFVDEDLAAQYRSEQNLGRIVRISTGLSVLIGFLGLYGLASLNMQTRTREISIRKVMGASERSLMALLTREYAILVVVSVVLSVPATVYFMNQWLTSFEYRVPVGPSTFLLAGVLSLAVALLTVLHQTIRTARSQPADVLKYE